jgi:hypothetical protein
MTQSTNNPDAPRSIQPRVSTQRVGSEILVYDPSRHMAFCLNRSSSVVWSLADGERTVAEISAAASFELGTSVSEEFVSFALEQLRGDGLIEPPETAKARPVISRRTLLRRLGAGGALLLPVVAAIVAPTAAQAYSGCVDCSAAPASRSAQRAARARRQSLGSSGALGPVSNSGSLGTFSPYTTPSIGQPANQPAKPHR